MVPDEKIMCHHTGFEKSCFDMVTKCKCRKWVNIRGEHPQTKTLMDQWDCADAWLPLTNVGIIQSIENRVGGVQAATESFRNEMVSQNNALLAGPRIVQQQALPQRESSEPPLQLENIR